MTTNASVVAIAALGLLTGSLAAAAELPPSPEGDGMARAQQLIAAREYWASRSEQGLQAPNRAHDLRTYFEASGIRVHTRTEPGRSELLSLRLAGVGRGESLAPIAAGVVASEGPRVEIRREGIVEWYLNGPAGLEQGFTLAERPTGEGPLVLELAVSGATALLRGDEVVLASAAGRRLTYRELHAVDASGQGLPARLEVPGPGRVRLLVDDAGATYPLVIDPLLDGATDTRLESNQAGAQLGFSAASAGDVNGDGFADVIVGAPFYDAGSLREGAAFVFLGSAAGIANGNPATAATQIESNQAVADLGQSVASAGDVNGDGFADVIVGAPAYDAGEANEGIALVFLGSATGIADGNPTTAAARLESNQRSANLGASVAPAGDVNGDGFADVIVGAFLYDAGTRDEGAAFVFLGSAAGMADGNPATAAAQLESDQVNAGLGYSVASAGDVNADGYDDVIAGAWLYGAGQVQEGAAFVFLGSAAGMVDGNPGSAAAQLESNQSQALLGTSVASAGDVNGDGYADVIVGSPIYRVGALEKGAAFVFLGSAAGIVDGNPGSAAAQILDPVPVGNEDKIFEQAQLGASVAPAGDVNLDGFADVIVGAPFFDPTGNANDVPPHQPGAAFVFTGSPTGIANTNPRATLTGDVGRLDSIQDLSQFGHTVASAGDVNGDGFVDLLVGARRFDGGQTDEGAVLVYLGIPPEIPTDDPLTASAQLESNQVSAQLGASVASAGDVNGDGFADVIVGAPLYNQPKADLGAAFVFRGSATGIVGCAPGAPPSCNPAMATPQMIPNPTGQPVGSTLGSSVAPAGDVNGDGFGDVIVGASLYDAGELNEGAAFVFLGSAAGIVNGNPETGAALLQSNQASAQLGASVASAGDVNGDGFADVIAGAPLYDAGEADEGAAFVFLGSATGIAGGNPATAAAQLESNQAGAQLGASVSAGDVNGDGFADAIAGARLYDAGQVDEGAAFVFQGSATGIASGNPATAAAQLESDQASAQLGASVASAGDVNGDSFADAIAGAPLYDAGQVDEGAAFVFLGSASGIVDGNPGSASAQLESDQVSAQLGASVAWAGDVNGDGFADALLGSPLYDVNFTDEGAAFVFPGSAAGIASGSVATAALRFISAQGGGRLGASVASAGDVNGDGLADMIVGAPTYQDPASGPGSASDEGAAFVFLGSAGIQAFALELPGEAGGDVPPVLLQAIPPVFDADGDGRANACDCDFDQNGVCGVSDWNILRQCFGLAVPAGGPPDDPSCAESDMDGDGVVGGADLNAWRPLLGASVESACP